MMGAFQIEWISAAIVVFTAALLVRLLVIARVIKRAVEPRWLTPALTAVMILAVSCFLAAVTGSDTRP
jgi:hypothetical protein